RWDAPSSPAPANEMALARLLGGTRAAILQAAENIGTTTEISRRADVLLTSVSQHMTVLRHAGLVQSTRQGGSTLHTITPLGHALLTGTLPWGRDQVESPYKSSDSPGGSQKVFSQE